MVLFTWSGYKQKERNHCDYLKKGHVILENCYTLTIINCKRATLVVRKSKKLLPPICWETNVGGGAGFPGDRMEAGTMGTCLAGSGARQRWSCCLRPLKK